MPSSSPSGELAFQPVSVLCREIAARRLSSVDLIEHCLDRIARHDGKLHAFTAIYEEDARRAAQAADKAIRAGRAVGPLHGIPIAVKDLVEMEGRITSGGSAQLRNRLSTLTATLVQRLIAQGMIIIGKTHTVEFAWSGWGINQRLGTPWNPWDLERARTPGGSSSGSGVAVAAGLVPCAIGTDTGGSVRLPAAFCGVTALKPTIGRISTHGVLPLSRTFDTPGILARDTADTALLLNVLQCANWTDVNTRGTEAENHLLALAGGVAGLRLARIPAREREGVHGDVLAAYDKALQCLAEVGAKIVDVELPFQFTECFEAHQTTMQAEAYAVYGSLVEDETTLLDPAVRRGIRLGHAISKATLLRAAETRDAMKGDLLRALSGVDALLTPTTETAAVPLNELCDGAVPSRFTRFVNSLGFCALALPNGLSATGLPLSLQIVSWGSAEATLFRVGHAFQQATDHHRRTPVAFPP
jgi:aspartyl-tRNA(Asn)/glutamyl-tRNA(Gln) amidotransferase subunit A